MKRKALLFLLVTIVVVVITVACSPSAPDPTPERPAATVATETAPSPGATTAATSGQTEAPATDVAPTAEAGAVSVPASADLTFEGSGGLPIMTTMAVPDGPGPFPAVMLLHMLGSDRTVWDQVGLVDALTDRGYMVLSVDMRGHGQTGADRNWELAAEDLLLVWDAFSTRENVDQTRTALIGASIGANLALRLAVDRPSISTVILLSPGLDYRGVTTEDAIAGYGTRPVLLVASEDDPYSADTVQALHEAAQGAAQVVLYNTAGHGTNMFGAEPELTSELLDWLLRVAPPN